MRYEIEVNVARKGSDPLWRSLVDDAGEPCVWVDESAAWAALRAEERGQDNARLVLVDATGIVQIITP